MYFVGPIVLCYLFADNKDAGIALEFVIQDFVQGVSNSGKLSGGKGTPRPSSSKQRHYYEINNKAQM